MRSQVNNWMCEPLTSVEHLEEVCVHKPTFCYRCHDTLSVNVGKDFQYQVTQSTPLPNTRRVTESYHP